MREMKGVDGETRGGGWDGIDANKDICSWTINCRPLPLTRNPSPTAPSPAQIANSTSHVLPSWLALDIRELLVSSLHSNYNTRCMAERAKDLVRHPSAAAREWVGWGGRSRVVSTSQVGYFCVSVSGW